MPETRHLEAGTPDATDAALDCLARGQAVALPSETVYGLFADATDPAAVARIYAIKGRPMFNPLIAHCCDAKMADAHGVLNDPAKVLAKAFWPGPLTLVVPRRFDGRPVCDLACAGLDTVGLRVPSQPALSEIIRRFGRPLAGPSANRSGRLSPTTAAAVAEDLGGQIEIIIDGGETRIGIESTIVACVDDTPRLLRPGGVPAEHIEAVLGETLAASDSHGTPQAPGMLASHYAPSAPLRLNATDVRPGEALLAFGTDIPDGYQNAVEVLNLSPRGDLVRAAANLFRYLRALDRHQPEAIAVMAVPETGLGVAIVDRLQRAAAPREDEVRR